MPELLADAAPALAATALRAAGLLAAVALLQTFLARRASAAVRHALWVVAFGVVLVLPAAEHPSVRDAAPEAAQIHRTASVLARPATPVASGHAWTPDARATTHVDAPEPAERPPDPQAVSPFSTDPISWAALLVAVWGAGTLVALGRLAASALAATFAVWRAIPDVHLSAEVGVPVRRSPEESVPYAWGLFRPVVVVPADFDAWPESERRAALAHESAHVRRRDPLVGFLARAALALHWPDPLVHYAVRRLDRERERAADDAVLRGGIAPVDYAHVLLGAAHRALAGRPAPRLAPAHAVAGRPGRSALAERVGAVLDGRARRRALSRAAGLGLLGFSLTLGAALSAFGTATHAPNVRANGLPGGPGARATPAWYRPPPSAERWAPALHSPNGWTYTPTFTPDLRTAYFVRWDAPNSFDPIASIQQLLVTRYDEATQEWSPPALVAATAGWRVDWPHVAPDGRLYVSTTRFHEAHYRFPSGLPQDFDLWAGRLDADGTLDAATFRPLDSPDLNRRKTPRNARIGYVHNETAPRLDRSGRLYFWTERLDDGGGGRDVYLAEPDAPGPDGKPRWRRPALLPFNTRANESGVAVDPDGQWVVFASEGRGGLGRSDLFVVVREGAGWGTPVNLGPEVNTRHREDSPEASPDGRALFFSTNRPGPGVPTVDSGEGVGPAASVYWVDLHAVPAFVRALGLPQSPAAR